ncbi:MAG: DEAD/DEAH box helicase [Actinobacteria bacterium]|jgi:superfamily II DNA/RNA helicase|nr:DEAD/DEAH box helicase [Actinomycetota bacterium]
MTAVSFASLGVDSKIIEGLASQGITSPLPIQAATLKDAILGRDICGKADTGSGKTLAFGIALLQQQEQGQSKHPRSLVLVPTRELAVQVRDVLASIAGPREVRVAVVYGGVSIEQQIKTIRRGADVVVATPGRLIDLLKRRAISLSRITSVVLDEADRMADMGFTPQVEEILEQTYPERQTMLFSATLDGDVDKLIKRHMNDPVRHEVASEPETTPKMTQYFLAVEERDRIEAVAEMAQGSDRTLIFVKTKRGADEISDLLNDYGIRSSSMHGDLRQSARNRVLERFVKGSLRVLVATDVAARGLDVSGLDLVIHYDLPEDHKAYIHRSGRTARGGSVGVVVTLTTPRSARALKQLQRSLGSDTPIYKVDPSDSRLSLLVKACQASEIVEFDDILEIRQGPKPQGRSGGGYQKRSGGFSRHGARSGSSGSGASRFGNAARSSFESSEPRGERQGYGQPRSSESRSSGRPAVAGTRRRSYSR